MRVTWLVDICHITHPCGNATWSYTWHDAFKNPNQCMIWCVCSAWYESVFIQNLMKWFISVFIQNPTMKWFLCAWFPFYAVCDMNESYVSRDYWKCATSFFHTRHVTRSYVWHDSCKHLNSLWDTIWLDAIFDMTHTKISILCVIWLDPIRDMTHPNI